MAAEMMSFQWNMPPLVNFEPATTYGSSPQPRDRILMCFLATSKQESASANAIIAGLFAQTPPSTNR